MLSLVYIMAGNNHLASNFYIYKHHRMVPSATQAFWGFGKKQTEMYLKKYPEKAHRLWEMKNNKKTQDKTAIHGLLYLLFVAKRRYHIHICHLSFCLSWQPVWRYSAHCRKNMDLGIVFHVVFLSILFYSRLCFF